MKMMGFAGKMMQYDAVIRFGVCRLFEKKSENSNSTEMEKRQQNMTMSEIHLYNTRKTNKHLLKIM